jgi:hypothetical protein
MVPPGFGVERTLHLMPFHCSARVKGTPPVIPPEFRNPTAMHDLAAVQEMSLNSEYPPRSGS